MRLELTSSYLGSKMYWNLKWQYIPRKGKGSVKLGFRLEFTWTGKRGNRDKWSEKSNLGSKREEEWIVKRTEEGKQEDYSLSGTKEEREFPGFVSFTGAVACRRREREFPGFVGGSQRARVPRPTQGSLGGDVRPHRCTNVQGKRKEGEGGQTGPRWE